jgi:Flp pilus assembly protein TadG
VRSPCNKSTDAGNGDEGCPDDVRMRFARFRPAPISSRRRRGKHGQGLVEFGLVAPIFFFTVFAMIDGGFLMFSINAVDQATTIATNSIASLGKVATADITSMQRMAASAGLQTTSLITITEIDVEGLVVNATQDGFSTHADGTPVILTGCSGGPGGVDGANECIDQYKFTGSGSTPTIVVINGGQYTGQCLSGDASGCPPWPPAVRNVFNGQSSFAALKVSYTYRFLTGIAPNASLTTTKTFRLEPQLAPGP